MRVEKKCKIVQDLLPNYIDGLTNDETNLFIEEHLKSCNDCQQILKNMKQKLIEDKPKKNLKEVKYIKKYNEKLKILKLIIFLILIIALAIVVHYYLLFKNAYFSAANQLFSIYSEGMYPDAFYATIEGISDTEVYGVKEITVKGLDINDKNHREKYCFTVAMDNVGDAFKIKCNGNDISFEQLKVGQTVAIYNYGDISEGEPLTLNQVRMIVVIDDAVDSDNNNLVGDFLFSEEGK